MCKVVPMSIDKAHVSYLFVLLEKVSCDCTPLHASARFHPVADGINCHIKFLIHRVFQNGEGELGVLVFDLDGVEALILLIECHTHLNKVFIEVVEGNIEDPIIKLDVVSVFDIRRPDGVVL